MSTILFSSWGSTVMGSAQADAPAIEANEVKLPPSFLDGRTLKAFMGWDGIILNDPEVSIVDMAREYMKKTQQESCGQCTPCRVGTRVMLEILNRVCEGRGTEEDLDMLESLAMQVKDGSMCDIGQTTPVPILHALTHFRDRFLAAVREKKPVPKGSYLAKTTAPCSNACPSHLDIPSYVENVRLGRFDEALKVIRNDCSLPGVVGRVCVRPCEFNCRRGLLDASISIKFLKRFAADYELEHEKEPPFPKVTPKKWKVAIVGAGPAGLACAYYLGLRGYRSVLFETLPEPGGMAAVGIPDYRLPRGILRREADFVEAVGSEIRYNQRLGRDFTLEELKSEYDAVFLGTGAHKASSMRCEGEDAGYEGFMDGVDFLREMALGKMPLQGKKIVVIGGGNVAIDCVRSAFRLGFVDANLVYRRTEAEMPADKVEIHDAKEEKIKFNFLTQPVKILAENNRVVGLECLRMELGEPDSSGRRRPVTVEGSNFVISADAVVPAIGQVCDLSFITPETGIETTRWGTIVVDERSFQTKQAEVFSGGDCVFGPLTLIAALASGKKAARFIAQYLETGSCSLDDKDHMEWLIEQMGVYNKKEKMPIVGGKNRLELEMLDPRERVHTFDEVEQGYDPAEAIKEASRCLRCYRIGMAAL